MKRKCIVLDLDDTSYNFLGPLVDLHNKLNGTRISPAQLTNWDFENLLMKDASGKVVNGADIRKTMNEYINDGFLASLEPNQFTKEAIDIAQELGYKVFFLTARPKTQEKQTIVSLLKYNIKHDGVIYQKNKAWALNELSKGYDIVTFVDDNVGYIKDAAKLDFIGRVFVLSCPHNYNEDIPANVGRVTNLMEVVSTLRNLK